MRPRRQDQREPDIFDQTQKWISFRREKHLIFHFETALTTKDLHPRSILGPLGGSGDDSIQC